MEAAKEAASASLKKRQTVQQKKTSLREHLGTLQNNQLKVVARRHTGGIQATQQQQPSQLIPSSSVMSSKESNAAEPSAVEQHQTIHQTIMSNQGMQQQLSKLRKGHSRKLSYGSGKDPSDVFLSSSYDTDFNYRSRKPDSMRVSDSAGPYQDKKDQVHRSAEKEPIDPSQIGTSRQSPWSHAAFGALASRFTNSPENRQILRLQHSREGIQEDSSLFKPSNEPATLMQSKERSALGSFLKRDSGSVTNNFADLATPDVVESSSPGFLREINNSTNSRPQQLNLHMVFRNVVAGAGISPSWKQTSPEMLSSPTLEDEDTVRRKLGFSGSKPMNKIFLFDKSPEMSEVKEVDGGTTTTKGDEQRLMQYLSNFPQFEQMQSKRSEGTYDSQQQNDFLMALAETLQELKNVNAQKNLVGKEKKMKQQVEQIPTSSPQEAALEKPRVSLNLQKLQQSSSNEDMIRMPQPHPMLEIYKDSPREIGGGSRTTREGRNPLKIAFHNKGTGQVLNSDILHARESMTTMNRPVSTLCIAEKNSILQSSWNVLNHMVASGNTIQQLHGVGGTQTSLSHRPYHQHPDHAAKMENFYETLKKSHQSNPQQHENKDLDLMQELYGQPKHAKIPDEQLQKYRNIVILNKKRTKEIDEVTGSLASISPLVAKMSHTLCGSQEGHPQNYVLINKNNTSSGLQSQTEIELRVSAKTSAFRTDEYSRSAAGTPSVEQPKHVRKSSQVRVNSRLGQQQRIRQMSRQGGNGGADGSTGRPISQGGLGLKSVLSKTGTITFQGSSFNAPGGPLTITSPTKKNATTMAQMEITGQSRNNLIESAATLVKDSRKLSLQPKRHHFVGGGTEPQQFQSTRYSQKRNSLMTTTTTSTTKDLLHQRRRRQQQTNRVKSAIDFCSRNNVDGAQNGLPPSQSAATGVFASKKPSISTSKPKSETRGTQATDPVPHHGEEEQQDKMAKEIQHKAKALFPFPIFDRNVQILIPKKGLQANSVSSPFLLALNQEKLTPFQTIRGFQKTKQLMIDQGLTASRTVNFNGKFCTQIKPQARIKSAITNPQIFKMRRQKQQKQQQGTTRKIICSPQQKFLERNATVETLPGGTAISIGHFSPNNEALKEKKVMKTMGLRREKQAQILYAVGVPMLTDTWAQSSEQSAEHRSSLEQLPKVGTKSMEAIASLVDSEHAYRRQYLDSKFANPISAKGQKNIVVADFVSAGGQKRLRKSKLRNSNDDMRNKRGSQFANGKHTVQTMSLESQVVKDQSTQNMLDAKDFVPIILDLAEVTDQKNGKDHSGGKGKGKGRSKGEKKMISVRAIGSQFDNTTTADGGKDGSANQEEIRTERRVVVEMVDKEEGSKMTTEGSAEKLFNSEPKLIERQNPNTLVSPQFLNRWTVEQNDKVIEVEEEASILNPTNRVSKMHRDPSTMSFMNQVVIEEMVDKIKQQIGKTNAKQTIQLSKNTITVPRTQESMRSQRQPFATTKKLVSTGKPPSIQQTSNIKNSFSTMLLPGAKSSSNGFSAAQSGTDLITIIDCGTEKKQLIGSGKQVATNNNAATAAPTRGSFGGRPIANSRNSNRDLISVGGGGKMTSPRKNISLGIELVEQDGTLQLERSPAKVTTGSRTERGGGHIGMIFDSNQDIGLRQKKMQLHHIGMSETQLERGPSLTPILGQTLTAGFNVQSQNTHFNSCSRVALNHRKTTSITALAAHSSDILTKVSQEAILSSHIGDGIGKQTTKTHQQLGEDTSAAAAASDANNCTLYRQLIERKIDSSSQADLGLVVSKIDIVTSPHRLLKRTISADVRNSIEISTNNLVRGASALNEINMASFLSNETDNSFFANELECKVDGGDNNNQAGNNVGYTPQTGPQQDLLGDNIIVASPSTAERQITVGHLINRFPMSSPNTVVTENIETHRVSENSYIMKQK